MTEGRVTLSSAHQDCSKRLSLLRGPLPHGDKDQGLVSVHKFSQPKWNNKHPPASSWLSPQCHVSQTG